MYTGKSGKERVTKIEFRFIGSLRFMRDSLDSLVGNLVGVSDFSHIDSNYVAHNIPQ